MIKIILTIIIVISLLTLLFISLYTKILVSKTRVLKAEKEIEDELNKRYKIIEEMKPIIEKSTKKEIKDFKELEDLKKTNVSTFDIDTKIVAITFFFPIISFPSYYIVYIIIF